MEHENDNIARAVIRAAAEAGALIRDSAFDYALEMKKKDDPVTTLDRSAERRIREVLDKLAPGNYVGEEYGRESHGASITYHIDPIDRTKSFVLRDFESSVSIGVERNDELIGGVVHDFMRDIAYAGFEGDCYLLHGGRRHEMMPSHPFSKVRLSIDNETGLASKLGDGYSVHERKGSIALAMAQLAAGNFDGMVCASTGKGNSWDVAAGYYLLHARGFDVRDIDGKPFDYNNGTNGIIAIRPDLERRVLHDLGMRE